MPQPIRAGTTFSSSPNPTWLRQHRPECVSAIGLVVIGWTRVEEELTRAISGIFGMQLIGETDWSIGPHWLIETVMQATSANNARIKIVDAILAQALVGSPLLEEWTNLHTRLGKQARDRNVVVHTGWLWSEGHPQGLIQAKKDGSFALWLERDFLDAFERIKSVENDLHRLMLLVIGALRDGSLVTPFIKPPRFPPTS